MELTILNFPDFPFGNGLREPYRRWISQKRNEFYLGEARAAAGTQVKGSVRERRSEGNRSPHRRSGAAPLERTSPDIQNDDHRR